MSAALTSCPVRLTAIAALAYRRILRTHVAYSKLRRSAAGGCRAWSMLRSAALGGQAMIDEPLALHEATVPEEWVDYNGHMSEWGYLLLVGDAADAFFRYVGIDEVYRAGGHSLYTAETRLHHLSERALHDRLAVRMPLPGAGPK